MQETFALLEEFETAGYNYVIYPVSTLRIAMGAVTDFLKDLKAEGHVKNSLDKMMTRDELYRVGNYKPGQEWLFPNPKKPDDE